MLTLEGQTCPLGRVFTTNAKRFKEMFKDDPTIVIPRVYDQYLSRHLLVLEWIDGIKINDSAALDAAGINRFEVAKRIAYAYFFQFFEAGFFHADPHPGNILVKPGPPGDEPMVALIDFGMVGSYTRQMQRLVKKAFLAVLARDARGLVNALARLGFIVEGTNRASLEQALALMIERYSGMTLGEVSDRVMAEMGEDVKQLLYGQGVHIPTQFVFTGRAAMMLIGVTSGLASEFNLLEVAVPYARKFLGLDMKSVEHTLQHLLIQLFATSRALLRLPEAVEQVLTKLETGQLEVSLESRASRGWGGVHGRRGVRGNGEASAMSGFTWPFMFALSLAGGIFLLTGAHQIFAGWVCFALAGLCTLRAWAKN